MNRIEYILGYVKLKLQERTCTEYGIIKMTDTINMQISTARLIFILVVNFLFILSWKILYRRI